jgi:hypothetical protein
MFHVKHIPRERTLRAATMRDLRQPVRSGSRRPRRGAGGRLRGRRHDVARLETGGVVVIPFSNTTGLYLVGHTMASLSVDDFAFI